MIDWQKENAKGAAVENKIASDSGANRKDTGKPRMDLLDPIALEGIAAVLAMGARKYAEHNWRKGMSWGQCLASLLRHTFKFMNGEDLDEESGLPHVDHIACNAMFLCRYFRSNKALDDRYKAPITVPCVEGGTATLTFSPPVGVDNLVAGGCGIVHPQMTSVFTYTPPPGDEL